MMLYYEKYKLNATIFSFSIFSGLIQVKIKETLHFNITYIGLSSNLEIKAEGTGFTIFVSLQPYESVPSFFLVLC